jgi:undecaprenyl-diphosphatase
MENAHKTPVSVGDAAAGPMITDRDLHGIRHALRPLLISLVSATFFLIFFAWISEEVFEGDFQRFDSAVRMEVHQYFGHQLTRFMLDMTFLGSIGFLTALFAIIVAVYLALGKKRSALWLAVAVGGSAFLDVSLKLAFQRARPTPFVGSVPHSYSFPSGHALSSFCFYGVLAGLLCSRIPNRAIRILIWVVAAALIFAIGLSRIYLGVHYPTDVVAGYIAAAAWVSALLFAERAERAAKARAVTVR